LLENGSSLTLAGITNFDSSSITVQNGSVLSLPSVANFTDLTGCCGILWQAVGAGSRIEMPALTNLIGHTIGPWGAAIQAVSGGQVLLTNLARIAPNGMSLTADG